MNTDIDFTRERVINQVLSADSLPEIEAAKQLLRGWLTAHPEEHGMRDGFEKLYTIQEINEEEAGRTEDRERPAASSLTNSDKQRILDLALEARTIPEIAAATQKLREWARQSPNDVGIREASEGLSMMRDFAEEQEAEHRHAPQEVVSAAR